MEKTTLTVNQLRNFGFMLTFVLFIFFGTLFPLMRHKSIPYWPWIIGFAIFVPTLTKPFLLKIIYTPWMKIGAVLGWINTRIILGLIFFLLITPMGLILRLFGKDLLSTQYDKSKLSYRKITTPQPIQHMEKPF